MQLANEYVVIKNHYIEICLIDIQTEFSGIFIVSSLLA